MSRLPRIVLLPLALAACARPPKNLAGDFPPITVAEAQRQATDGVDVRWGGALVETSPQKDRTCFEIVSLPLNREARPEPSDDSAGRFLACAPGFYDPTVYAPGREVTVVGSLHGQQTRKVGDYDYRLPVVDAKAVHLWEERTAERTGGRPGFGISIGGVFGGW